MTQVNPERVILALLVVIALLVVVNYLDRDGNTVCRTMVPNSACQQYIVPSIPTAAPSPLGGVIPPTTSSATEPPNAQ